MVAIESSVGTERRSATVASVTPAARPAAVSSAMPSRSICQLCSSSGRPPRTAVTTAACASVSVTTATAPESPRIHCTCSAEEVS